MGPGAGLPVYLRSARFLHYSAFGAQPAHEARDPARCDWCVLEYCRGRVDLERGAGIRAEVVFNLAGCEFATVCLGGWEAREKIEEGERGKGRKRERGEKGKSRTGNTEIDTLRQIYLNDNREPLFIPLFPLSPIPRSIEEKANVI